MPPRLPAEWEQQRAIMLTWPHEHSDWARWLTETDKVFTTVTGTISQYQDVFINCRDATHRTHITALLTNANTNLDKIYFSIADSNDSWTRDHGPITVYQDHQPQLLDFTFNGWGNKYPADKDNVITKDAWSQGLFGNHSLHSHELVLEGGSIDVDGKGSLLTTEACLLAPSRNPDLDRSAIEKQLKQHLGIKRILWLKHGWLAGDDTDSHIDMLARFCSPDTIAYSCCEDADDIHYQPLTAMKAELTALRQDNGLPYRLIPLPIPRAIYHEGQRLPASYANFLIINGAVLVPGYGDVMDKVAQKRLYWAFPGRKIIPIDCHTLIHQYGSLHCTTMQLPAGI